MKKIGNDVEIEIHKTWYNKAKLQEDGVTYLVQPEKHIAYQVGMAKNYYIENRDEVIDALIADLRTVIVDLEKLKGQEQEIEK